MSPRISSVAAPQTTTSASLNRSNASTLGQLPAAEPVTPLSFTDFYKSNFHALVVLASAVARDETFAEDIVQETMSLVHDRWQQLQARDTAKAWARRTVVNRSIDRKRRIWRERRAADKLWEHPNQTQVPPIENRVLWDAVRSLPTNQRVAVVLYYIDGYSTDEIADVLNCSGSSARTSLHRARKQLGGKLGSRASYEGRQP